MENVIYKYTNEFNEIDIKKLYENAGWTAYTQDLPKLMEALRTSLSVVSAWDGDRLN